MVGYYRRRNDHRSLAFAQKAEAEWQLNKPKEIEYDDEEASDSEEAPVAAPAGGAADSEAEEEE